MKSKVEKHKGYTSPPTPQKGYDFVAAAMLFRNYGGLCVFVKYKSGDLSSIKVKDIGSNHIWLICPDRELVIVRNAHESGSFYPWGDSFDEVWDMNTFNDHACRELGINYVMTNYAHVNIKEKRTHPRYKSKLPDSDRIHVLSDSGGLQLVRGVTGLIHPAELIDFYNHNTDAGMVLDVPIAVKDRATVIKAANIQKANSDIMLSQSTGAELINIFHGHTSEDRKIYREICEDPRINRVAIPGLHRQTLMTGMNEIYHTIFDTKQRYKQYHALGIYSSSYIPLFVKMANVGEEAVHITSDSSSHVQSASNRAYHFQFDIFHNLKRLPIGSRGSAPNTRKLLPCQCPVCKVLKYTDILAFASNRYVNELLALHNAIEMVRYASQLQEFVRQNSSVEYTKLVERQISRNTDLKEVKAGLDFIDIVGKYGVKEARKKYKTMLNHQKTPGLAATKSLFGEVAESATAERHKLVKKVVDAMEENIKEWKKNPSLDKVLKNKNASVAKVSSASRRI